MATWSTESARSELASLIALTDRLKGERRMSTNHVRWVKRTTAFLGEVFGQDSDHYEQFTNLPWKRTDAFVMGGPADPEGSWNPAAAIEKRHQQAYVEQLDIITGASWCVEVGRSALGARKAMTYCVEE